MGCVIGEGGVCDWSGLRVIGEVECDWLGWSV